MSSVVMSSVVMPGSFGSRPSAIPGGYLART
jgi:hypothetical protein